MTTNAAINNPAAIQRRIHFLICDHPMRYLYAGQDNLMPAAGKSFHCDLAECRMVCYTIFINCLTGGMA